MTYLEFTTGSLRACVDLGNKWAYINYKHALRISGMKVGLSMLSALLMQNAYATMNGNETASYFGMPPPEFEEWTRRGPQERRLNIFG